MENLTTEALCAVVTLLCTIIWAVVIRPLQVAISELKELISDIRNDMKLESEKRANIEIRVSVLEERVDNLEGDTK